MSFASTRWIIRAGIVLAGVATLAVACVTDEHPRPKCNELADGGTPIEVPEASAYLGVPTTDAQSPEDLGMEPDPGPTCTDCQQASDVEVLLIHDFEQGFAPTWFNYGEPGVPITPPQVGPGTAADHVTPANVPMPYWGLQVPALAEMPGGERCGSRYALHMAGGRFLSWGGGFVSLSVTVRGALNVLNYCPDNLTEDETGIGMAPTPIGDTCNFFITPAAGQPSRRGMDVSDYDGISFWARRHPGAQSTLRIALNDQNTSEGPALQAERDTYFAEHGDPNKSVVEPACKRVVGCCRQCNPLERDVLFTESRTVAMDTTIQAPVGIGKRTEGRCQTGDAAEWQPPKLREGGPSGFQFQRQPRPGQPLPEGGMYPWEDVGTDSSAYKTAFDEWEREIKLCCPPTMEEEIEGKVIEGLGDPQFGGRECNPYVFNYDYSSGYYCWGPGDPPLPERNENRCGDGFEGSVNVDTEWRFFRIPWGELRRFTPNRSPVDPTGIWSVALYFGQGYLDFYVDDIGFYRKRR